MLPASRDLVLYRGDRYEHVITFTDRNGAPLPMTGTWRSQIRPGQTSENVSATFAVDDTNAAAGELVISLTGEQTAVLPPKCVWDLEDTATQQTFMAGKIEVRDQVTR